MLYGSRRVLMRPPTVSIIVPVYNAVDYVDEALKSIYSQTLAQSEIEIIAVNDGSTDGSELKLRKHAASRKNIRLLEQPNSGTPGGARNPGLDIATGRYVFFLDADDELTPNALRALTSTADVEGSDIVLGKAAGLGGRRPPASMFKTTVLDADLVKDNLFNTLAPWKLFRMSLIESLQLRFPTDLRIGEDQPFVAKAYLNAKKISILSDQVYYLMRARDDGQNITKGQEDLTATMRKTTALIDVISSETPAGPRRNALMRRPLQWSLSKALDTRFLRANTEEQEASLASLQCTLGPIYNAEMALHLTPINRIKTHLALNGTRQALYSFIEWAHSVRGSEIESTEAGFFFAPPKDLVAQIPRNLLKVDRPEPLVSLSRLTPIQNGIRLEITVGVKFATTPPESVHLRLITRGESAYVDYEPQNTRPFSTPTTRGLDVDFKVSTHDLSRGIWDLSVVQRFPSGEIRSRLGRTRSRRILSEGFWVESQGHDGRVQETAVYFTKGTGNLSLDVGANLHPDSVVGRLLGIIRGSDGKHRAIIATSSPPAQDITVYLSPHPAGSRGKRHPLPHVCLSPGVYEVTLPSKRGRSPYAFYLAIESQNIVSNVALPKHLHNAEYRCESDNVISVVPQRQHQLHLGRAVLRKLYENAPRPVQRQAQRFRAAFRHAWRRSSPI